MTKKDYLKIATWIRKYEVVKLTDSKWSDHKAIYALIDILQNDNPAFDEDRFMKYINTEIDKEYLSPN